MVPALVPLPGETESQLADSVAFQESVPPPALLTASVFALGLVAPTVPLKLRLDGLTAIAGAAGAPPLKTTVAIIQGVDAPVETRAAGVLPRGAGVSSTTNSM